MTFTPPPNAPHSAHRLSQLLHNRDTRDIGWTYSNLVFNLSNNDDRPVTYTELYNAGRITEPELTAHLRTLLNNHDIIAVKNGHHITYRLPQPPDHDIWQAGYTAALRDISNHGMIYQGTTPEPANPTPNPYPQNGATT